MELKYIWVDQFRSIENLGFNFSHTGDHQFNYLDSKLILKPNSKCLLNFGSKVSSVTAIAGQNGSGKSSLCEVIAHSMATLKDGALGYDIHFKGIVCNGDYVFVHNDISLSNEQELLDAGYVIERYKESPLESMSTEWSDSLLRQGFIYYSNVIDWRSDIDQLNLVNISTQKQLKDYTVYGPHFSYYDSEWGRAQESTYNADKIGVLEAFALEESIRNTMFYLDFKDALPNQGPIWFRLDASYSQSNAFVGVDQSLLEGMSYLREFEGGIFHDFYHGPTNHESEGGNRSITIDQSLLKQLVKQLYRLNLIKTRLQLDSQQLDIEAVRSFVYENADWMFDDIERVSRLTKLHSQLVDAGNGLEQYNPNSMATIFHTYPQEWRFYALKSIWINNTESARTLLGEFLHLEREVVNKVNDNRRISDCSMGPKLSSGENSYYSLFARLYAAIKNSIATNASKESFVLFIDEAEIGFHPDWKKKLIKWLLKFINSEFHDFQFQIIITTHSPYLLSDLSRENLILLKRSEQGKTQLVLHDGQKVFGANIYELLSDSFFLKDGFIGEYAQGVLEDLVAYLKSVETESESFHKERAKAIINIVADDIIRLRLEDLYEQKFDEPVESLSAERDLLVEKLRQIDLRMGND